MDSPDQSADLVSGDLIATQIRANDLHGEFSMGQCSRQVVGHSFSPIRAETTIPGPFHAANEDSPSGA
jgi:hypothetical protein